MMFWKEINFLHTNLPYPLLKLWGSSDKLVSLTKKLAFGGDGYIRYHKLFKEMENWTFEKFYEFQYGKLKGILKHTYENVPFYKSYWKKNGVKPSDIKCLEDLQKIPIITKDDLKGDSNTFFARNLKHRRNMYRDTSGTSGRSTRFYRDENTVAALYGTLEYYKDIIGLTPNDVEMYAPSLAKETNLLSSDSLRFGFHSPIINKVIFPSDFVGDAAFKTYIKFIKKFKIKYASGFHSTFFAFAKYVRSKNEAVKFKRVLLSGEVLYNFQRKFIEKSFGCEFFQGYGSAESIIRCCECTKHKGMHISPIGIAEVKDRGLEGKGDLVMTTLTNYLFPLIRYNIKDGVTLSNKKCGCGRPFPRLMNVEGRSNEFIMLPTGECLHHASLVWIAVYVSGIEDIYFLQHEDYGLDVLVVKEKKGNANEIRRRIGNKLNQYLKDKKGKLKYRIIFKGKVERKTHKHRTVETKVAAYKKMFNL